MMQVYPYPIATHNTTVTSGTDITRPSNGKKYGRRAYDKIAAPKIDYGMMPQVNQPCLWDSIPEEDRSKPMMLSCPCPKCSPWC